MRGRGRAVIVAGEADMIRLAKWLIRLLPCLVAVFYLSMILVIEWAWESKYLECDLEIWHETVHKLLP